jgi:hypothetical protein
MEVRLSFTYDYGTVGCFDPERVLNAVAKSLTQFEFDQTDWAQREVEDVCRIAVSSGTTPDGRAAIERQIKRKASRIGPVF